MNMVRIILLVVSVGISSLSSSAQNLNKLLRDSWTAKWVTCPDIRMKAYGVYHFRKTIELAGIPKRFIIHVSADNRYHLFVNGISVGRGPARSSLHNWNFGSYDIAPYLRPGKNIIAALVWNMGQYKPVAQMSYETGFLLQGDSIEEQIANTNDTWKVLHDTAYKPCALNTGAILRSYIGVGPGDDVHGNAYPWGWKGLRYDDVNWKQAKELHAPVHMAEHGIDSSWTLAPRAIPPMEETMQRLSVIRRDSGIKARKAFLKGMHPLTIPAHSQVTILLDNSFETVAYPVLKVSRGKGSYIKLTYAEALLDKNGLKGNRNDIKGKKIMGFYDIFYPDGGDNRTFSSLWIRTYRYLQIAVKTGNEPLVINDLYGIYTGYPFKHKASFSCSDPSLQDIWKVGWRTARLCAGETYFDCPYYEQLQYEGDTRIQALISLYNTGDDRLVRKAINDFYNSRIPEGLTQGRYPNNSFQVIPTYSLFWVSMLYDYWMYCPNSQFLNKYLDAADIILKWYERHIDTSYEMLGPMEWWNFVDWDDAFTNGVPDGAADGHSSIITLQYAYTLRQAAQLFAYFGRRELADHDVKLAGQLAVSTYRHCFDVKRMEMANRPQKLKFSQHAGIMAILAGAIPSPEQKKVMEHILYDSSLSQCTLYYRFYLTRALVKAGLGDLYYSQLAPWRNMLKMGLTTFAEKPDPTRSDCHAWSASPEYDFLSTICGIMPGTPGFASVRIRPALGPLKEVRGAMPVPQGMVAVHVKRTNQKGAITVDVTLPGKLTGTFIWNGRKLPLHGGGQQFNLR